MGEGRQQRRGRHEDDQHARHATTGVPTGPPPQRLRESRVAQAGSEDEDGGDDDRRLALEPGERLFGAQDASQREGENDEQGDHVGAHPLCHQQSDGGGKDREKGELMHG